MIIYKGRLLRRRLQEVLEERLPLLVLFDAREDHLRPLDELLGVREPLVHGVLIPGYAAARNRAGEREAVGRAGGPPEDPVQVRALLVRAARLDGVALAAPAVGVLRRSMLAARVLISQFLRCSRSARTVDTRARRRRSMLTMRRRRRRACLSLARCAAHLSARVEHRLPFYYGAAGALGLEDFRSLVAFSSHCSPVVYFTLVRPLQRPV